MTDKTKPATRATLLAQLDELKWEGPRSYTVTDLRDLLVPWVAAGCPKDGAAPAGALAFVYPPERKTREPKQSAAYGRGYQQALADIDVLPNLKAIREYLADNLRRDGNDAEVA